MLKETREVFANPKKIPTLRRSPAIIVWPSKPENEPEVKTEIMTEVKPKRKPRIPKEDVSGKLPKIPEVEKQNALRDSVVEDNVEDDDREGDNDGYAAAAIAADDDEDELVVLPKRTWKPRRDHDFWKFAIGNMRIDSLFLASPRPDPYHSAWTPDRRRCYFISDLATPPHMRHVNPVKLLETAAAQSARDLSSATKIRKTGRL
ncbi:uncharacterized protein LOC101862073 [Aplysia californica]|uniref:Uncharacterized protein LOC101862073 n=1 Tax=Aplysia californica TaxID=6500 RepID=A0ABM0K5W0_APLCA|nr:uncharacterized protein LOC101862073 [Aplysia californica]